MAGAQFTYRSWFLKSKSAINGRAPALCVISRADGDSPWYGRHVLDFDEFAITIKHHYIRAVLCPQQYWQFPENFKTDSKLQYVAPHIGSDFKFRVPNRVSLLNKPVGPERRKISIQTRVYITNEPSSPERRKAKRTSLVCSLVRIDVKRGAPTQDTTL